MRIADRGAIGRTIFLGVLCALLLLLIYWIIRDWNEAVETIASLLPFLGLMVGALIFGALSVIMAEGINNPGWQRTVLQALIVGAVLLVTTALYAGIISTSDRSPNWGTAQIIAVALLIWVGLRWNEARNRDRGT